MEPIEIKKIDDFPQARFDVTVRSNSVTMHRVTLTKEYYVKLTAGAVTAEELIEKSFEFLLAREPNTSILSAFDLTLISKYFPDYERKIKRKIQAGI